MSLTIEVERSQNVLIVRLNGELDHHMAGKVRKEMEDEMEKAPFTHFILNLEKLGFMDSSGLGVILGRYKKVSQLGGKMMLCSGSPAINRLMEMSGLFKVLSMYTDENSALCACEVTS